MVERKNDESLADRSLKLERVFDAPRALVFEVCSKTEHINRWMCPKGFTIPSSTGDFRVGGMSTCARGNRATIMSKAGVCASTNSGRCSMSFRGRGKR